MTSFGNGVFTDVIKLTIFGEDYFGFRVSPKSNDWCSYKMREIWTYGHILKMPCDNESKDLSDGSIN